MPDPGAAKKKAAKEDLLAKQEAQAAAIKESASKKRKSASGGLGGGGRIYTRTKTFQGSRYIADQVVQGLLLWDWTPQDCRFRIQSSFQNLLPLDLLLPALAILSRSINFLIFNLIDLSSHSFLWRTVAEKVVESTPSFHLSHQPFGSAAGIERYCRSNSTTSLLYYRHFTVLDIGNHRSPLQEPADKVVESIRSFHSSHQLPGSAVGIKRYLTIKSAA
ncbi:hypothetical protein Pst134EB_006452 [Puccinia striiformis f. sp. tritici]|nr:hypothetical protein Pst134EB_006452 [Puccinia striiformis f. sp. tritici]